MCDVIAFCQHTDTINLYLFNYCRFERQSDTIKLYILSTIMSILWCTSHDGLPISPGSATTVMCGSIPTTSQTFCHSTALHKVPTMCVHIGQLFILCIYNAICLFISEHIYVRWKVLFSYQFISKFLLAKMAKKTKSLQVTTSHTERGLTVSCVTFRLNRYIEYSYNTTL